MATKIRQPFDISKFQKGITKNIEGISQGFESDPKTWVSTGNYVLNWLVSGDFNRGIPLGRVSMLAGYSQSGKSYIASGNVIKNAQDSGIFVVLVDTENAINENWLKKFGVDTSPDAMMKIDITLIDDLSKYVSDFMKSYGEAYKGTAIDDQPPVLFVVDSLGMTMSKSELDQAISGDLKGDMGRKAKALKQFVNFVNSMFKNYNIGMLATNHVYDSQDMFNPDPKISGGNGFVFASSVVISMDKGKLKEDEDGNKTKEVNGIRAFCRVMKTRFNPIGNYKKVDVKISFENGMDPYSGLFDFIEETGLLKREGNRYSYTFLDGEVLTEFRKNFTEEHFNRIMEEFPLRNDKIITAEDEPLSNV